MPTLRQKRAFEKVVKSIEEGKIQPMGKVMREVGYPEATSVSPKVLTDSKGWKELMEKYLPDKLLTKKHRELLTIPKKIRQFKKGELMTEVEELHTEAVKAGLDMAYKLKGKYAPEKHITLNISAILDDLEIEK